MVLPGVWWTPELSLNVRFSNKTVEPHLDKNWEKYISGKKIGGILEVAASGARPSGSGARLTRIIAWRVFTMTKAWKIRLAEIRTLNLVLLLILLQVFSMGVVSAQGQQDQKNIILIVSDDLNTSIGPYLGIDDFTPNLDRSRASFMSGLYPETNGVLRNKDEPGSYRAETPALADHPSMAGFFRENGYYTARVSKIFHMGVPGGIERGDPGGDDPDSWDYAYNVMAPETLSPGELELLSPGNLHYGGNFSRMILGNEHKETQADYLAVNQALAILENRTAKSVPGATNKGKLKPDAPFFLGVGLVRPHVPFVAPQYCYEPHPDEEMEVPAFVINDNVPDEALARQNQKIWKMSETQKQKTISGYMASVRFMDEQVGRLLDGLDRLGIRDETIIVFISDHGYNLGEHDCWSKLSLWEGSVRVPMIISHPDHQEPGGKVVEKVIELIDLYPTLAEFGGLSDTQPDILQGESLAGYIDDAREPANREFAYTVTRQGQSASLRTKRWRYTRWGEEAQSVNEELYDHQNDPEEHVNLVGNARHVETLELLRSKFEGIRQQARNGLPGVIIGK
jgi:arylsulfatase A-like enzyme